METLVWCLGIFKFRHPLAIMVFFMVGCGVVHFVLNLFYPISFLLSGAVFSIALCMIGVIWGIKIWRDPNLSKEEKWRMLNGK